MPFGTLRIAQTLLVHTSLRSARTSNGGGFARLVVPAAPCGRYGTTTPAKRHLSTLKPKAWR